MLFRISIFVTGYHNLVPVKNFLKVNVIKLLADELYKCVAFSV